MGKNTLKMAVLEGLVKHIGKSMIGDIKGEEPKVEVEVEEEEDDKSSERLKKLKKLAAEC